MKNQILMSTMNKKNISELEFQEKKIDLRSSVIVINQLTNLSKKQIINEKNFFSFEEKGLSKSRNRALNKVNEGICIIADDDIFYTEKYVDIIEEAYLKNPDADIITFQVQTPDGKLFKNYPSKKYYHNKYSILKVSSIEITFRSSKIKEKEIKFDEKFGLGSEFPVGEEAIFLKDCLDQGLKILYIPKVIVCHKKESTGDNLDSDGIKNKGAVFRRIYKKNAGFLSIIFHFKKFKLGNLKNLKYYFEGIREYEESCKL